MNKLILTILSMMLYLTSDAQVIQGVITDKSTKKPIVGAFVILSESSEYAISGVNGEYEIKHTNKDCLIEVSHVNYEAIEPANVKFSTTKITVINFELEQVVTVMQEVLVVGRAQPETITALKNERKNSNVAIENIGTQEMAIKGLSNAEDGVKKITSVSLNDGQLFVRGLGDRYSLTTLNGLPIASPNPDNKIIPLDIFPSSTISNITVSKVYQVGTFADYSGAHINIDTRKETGKDFFKLSLSSGGQKGAMFNSFYKSDTKSMFSSNNIPTPILDMQPTEFSNHIKTNDVFGTDFSIKESTTMPDFSTSVAGGKTWNIGEDKLSVLASASISNSYENKLNSYTASYNAQGVQLNNFDYDSYTQELKIAALASASYYFSNGDLINYVFFYARNASDNYKIREGFDSEGVNLVGSNSVFHSYALLNNQMSGVHTVADRLKLRWNTSYGQTQSDEPDRRQVMYRKGEDGKLNLFKLNQQETMRYFGNLSEDEIVGEIDLKYEFGFKNSVRLGGAYKNKKRDYRSTRFYYNLKQLNPVITDVFNPDSFLNQDNISNGTLTIMKDSQPNSSYFAGSSIIAGFAEVDFYITSDLLLNAGVRYEKSEQWVRYWTDASMEETANLDSDDFFPAINIKYDLHKHSSLRLALSKTVTRPSFIEMAPFQYKESYGSAEIRGNDNLQNGYNYNIDLRYELYDADSNDMFSITGYYKYLSTPIESIQEMSGGSVINSFRNADNGAAMGVELEVRKSILPNLGVGFNGAYMYTNVILPDGGVYTDSQRALQGASPYLLNADVTYMYKSKKGSNLSLSLLYNFQGPRIETVGISGMNNIIQESFHTLDFVTNYKLNKNWSFNLQLENLLNSQALFTQEVDGNPISVENYYDGMKIKIGVSFNL